MTRRRLAFSAAGVLALLVVAALAFIIWKLLAIEQGMAALRSDCDYSIELDRIEQAAEDARDAAREGADKADQAAAQCRRPLYNPY